MIAFNGQYLPAASHGNMRITAACLGGQWVIGGNWLALATQQAIIAAFGAEEGIAVISRTNDYLNALALTDPTRAQQLAMFINEDPLLVCSLVETSKTRWLVNSGGAKVSAPNVVIKYGDSIFLKWKGLTALSATQDVVMIGIFTCGSWSGTSNIHIAHQHKQWGNKQVRYGFLTSGDCYQNPTHEYTVDKVYDCLFGKAVAKVNGVSLNAKALGTIDCDGTTATMLLCSEETSAAMTDVIIKNEAGDIKYHFAPCSTKEQGSGMLDIISGTFYPNANTEGAFTIAITDKQ